MSDLDDDSFADGTAHKLACVSSMPNFKKIPSVVINDPVQEDDPWRSPTRAEKTELRSGWTPEIEMRKKQMQELLAKRHEVRSQLEALRLMLAATSADDNLALVLAKITELTVGVNELRVSQATQSHAVILHDFYKAFNLEHKAFVASQIEPLRDQVSDLSAASTLQQDRLSKLEAQMTSGGVVGGVRSSGPNPHDATLCQVAFIGFPKEANSAQRVADMERFMQQHFPELQVKHVDVSFNRDCK